MALTSGAPVDEEIPDADFEIVAEIVADDADVVVAPSDEAFTLDDDADEEDDDDDEAVVGAIGGDPLTPDARDAWLNEPLRTTPTDAAEDDLTS